MKKFPTLFMMVGLPGSGKSYYAREMANMYNANIHSSDEIREELNISADDKKQNSKVFQLLHKRIKQDLLSGVNTIYDATNLNRKKRVNFLKEIDKVIPCTKIAIFMAVPYEKCCLQNENRQRVVPKEVMERMYRNFEMPTWYEGFDKVYMNHLEEDFISGGDVSVLINSLKDCDQHNSYHKLTLGEHMEAAYQYILQHDRNSKIEVHIAALCHDIGKVHTASRKNSKGEADENIHYYNHENVGSYDSLFLDMSKFGSVHKGYIALLIGLHMKPLTIWKESLKTLERDIELFGPCVIQDVMSIHKADLNAH